MTPGVAVILVFSTSYALKVEKTLKGAGIACKLIPVPRHLSSDCGVCVRIEQAYRLVAEALLVSARVETEGIYDL